MVGAEGQEEVEQLGVARDVGFDEALAAPGAQNVQGHLHHLKTSARARVIKPKQCA